MSDDNSKMDQFLGKMVSEMGAASSAALVLLGDKLGLYKALSSNGALTAVELAERTNTFERYVREWLAAQAAAGYVEYDSAGETFSMTPEQTAVFGMRTTPRIWRAAFTASLRCFWMNPR